jgi:hypothetical protein
VQRTEAQQGIGRLRECGTRRLVPVHNRHPTWRCFMLMTIAIIMIALWLLGMVSAYTMGGLIHLLLVVAVIVVLVRVIQGRRGI